MSKDSIDLFKALLHTSKIVVRAVFTQCGMGQLNKLTGPQFELLMAIHRKGTVSPSELSDLILVTPANITGMIARLQKFGLVDRRRLASDRRCLKIGLTPLGHEKIEAIIPVWQKAANEYFSTFPAEDRHTLTFLLNKLRDSISAYTKKS